MSMMGMRGANHPNAIAARGGEVDDATDDRATHPVDFAEFSARFGPFTLDVAASAANHKVDRYITRDDRPDGLASSWEGHRVWCNPPFSDVGAWVRKAWLEWRATDGITMLLPANRTEQTWWGEMVEPFRDRPYSPLSTHFLQSRRRFLRPGQTATGPGERPPFGVVLLVWDTTWADQQGITYTGQPAPVDGGLPL